MITFQELIHRLSSFWEKKGCIIHQGHDLEMGAGTFNPATFLRCLGPEPYRTAYVEPSRRPGDGRYGENPNRVQLFHQYQVIIKPCPDDIKETYLQSLEAIGFNLKEHDVRFVHDDWEGPTLGAWGLGWEVWIDGMEITQFTYFQAVGSVPLNPVSVELTYGLERLCMYLQKVDNIFDVKWNNELTLGDISKMSEVEWSTYNFEEASVSMWHKHFQDFEQEAKRLIEKKLPIPAYDFVIKASHAFNILDARGVISVTERTGYITRIRDLARLVAMGYIESRETQGFPLLKQVETSTATFPALEKDVAFDPEKKQTFLLEIGSEELPATFVPIGAKNLKQAVESLFTSHKIPYGKVHVYSTPRRLAILVEDVAEGIGEQESERRGPLVDVAFNEKGLPTEQGKGFLTSLGAPLTITIEEIRSSKNKTFSTRFIKDKEYLFAALKTPGVSTYHLLATQLKDLILNIEFPKKMHWSSMEIRYARPIRWLLALFGEQVVPFNIGSVVSSSTSYGHFQLANEKIAIKSPSEYIDKLRQKWVVADQTEREQLILDQLRNLEEQKDGTALEKAKVLKQVINLSEHPQLTFGTFKEEFLSIPQEILISEMVEHQKYFPFASKNGKLKNLFIITADNTPSDQIRKGNERVLSARLNDGVFLYQQDLKAGFNSFIGKLKEMTFQKDLGSMLDKTDRIKKHAKVLNEMLNLADSKKVSQAAELCKADLASGLVGEFPELQGVIGRYYAEHAKYDKEVALAIEEHWMPTSEQGCLPSSPTGIIVSMADKIDNLLGYYSVGLIPSSSSDPYALRRQTLGIIKILVQNQISIDLDRLLTACASHFPVLAQDKEKQREVVEAILKFFTSRAKVFFEESVSKKDIVEASIQGVCKDPYDLLCRIQALEELRKDQRFFPKLLEVYKRAKGQLGKHNPAAINPSVLKEKAEKDLYSKLEEVSQNLEPLIQKKQYQKAFGVISELQPFLAVLFDEVKILDDDPSLRGNRLALLKEVFTSFEKLVDFSKIQDDSKG